MRRFLFAACLLAGAAAAQPADTWRATTAEEQRIDAAAFEGLDRDIGERLTDVQSVVVVLRGRVAYEYHRDGRPQALRDTHRSPRARWPHWSARRSSRGRSRRWTSRCWNWCRSGGG
jgi:hypothetical protein